MTDWIVIVNPTGPDAALYHIKDDSAESAAILMALPELLATPSGTIDVEVCRLLDVLECILGVKPHEKFKLSIEGDDVAVERISR